MKSPTILITGATGKTGSRIGALLEDAGHDVRHGSRRSDPPFDWQDKTTWQKALQGIRAVYADYVSK